CAFGVHTVHVARWRPAESAVGRDGSRTPHRWSWHADARRVSDGRNSFSRDVSSQWNTRCTLPARGSAARRGPTVQTGCIHTADYMKRIGVPDIAPATSPFDPGYDPATLASHLQQSAHLMSTLKISMACWIVANESATRTKLALARAHGVPTVTGGGPFEIAVAQGELPAYLDLCADVGVTRIECGQGFTDSDLDPHAIVAAARSRGLDVQMELGKKHDGGFSDETLSA